MSSQLDSEQWQSALLDDSPNSYHATILYDEADAKGQVITTIIRKVLTSRGLELYDHRKHHDSDHVSSARKVIMILSDNFISNKWQSSEALGARNKIQRLVPDVVLVVQFQSDQNLPVEFKDCPSIIYEETDDFKRRLFDSVISDPFPLDVTIAHKENIGAGFAYAQFFGYYKIVLPGIMERIRKSGISHSEDMCHKMIVVIPESCTCKPGLDKVDSRIKFHCWIPFRVTRASHKVGDYSADIYKIMDTTATNREEELKFPCDVPKILINLNAMCIDGEITEKQRMEELQQFYYILQHLVNKSETMRNQVSFLYYKDAKASLSDLLLKRVKQEIQREMNESPLPDLSGMSIAQPTDSMEQIETLPYTVEYTRTKQHYPMDRGGKALIISIRNFDNKPWKFRAGADRDEDAMIEILRAKKFDPIVRTDLTAEEIRHNVRGYSQSVFHEKCDASVLVLMSHGYIGHIMGRDWKPVSILELTEELASCQSLMGKPKIVFIQACMDEKDVTHLPASRVLAGGDGVQHGQEEIAVDDTIYNNRKKTLNILEQYKTTPDKVLKDMGVEYDADPEPQDVDPEPHGAEPASSVAVCLKSLLAPKDQHFIISYATLPGMVAYRTGSGSFYIQALKKNIKDYGKAECLEDTLKRLPKGVKDGLAVYGITLRQSQIPFYIPTVDKAVYLPIMPE